jgi:SAM-dependent methyltransferase
MSDTTDAGPSAGYYRTRFTENASRTAVWGHIVDWLVAEGLVARGSDVLELAAGYGDFVRHVEGGRRVAMDINPELPDFLPDQIEAVVGDCTDLGPFADHSFDLIFASNFLEHLEWPDVDRCVSAVLRVLRPGGRLLLLQPNFRLAPRRYFDDYTHRTIFTDQSLSDYLVSRGLELERVEARFLPLTMKSRLSGGHRLVPTYLRLPWRPLAGQMLVSALAPRSVEEGSS